MYVAPVCEAMVVNVTLSDDDCHWMVPVFPDKVKVVLFVPEQTVAAPAIDPAIDDGLTIKTPLTLDVPFQKPPRVLEYPPYNKSQVP